MYMSEGYGYQRTVLSSLSNFKTFPHILPCTFLENILEISIESYNLPFKVSKKIQLEPLHGLMAHTCKQINETLKFDIFMVQEDRKNIY